MNEQKRISDWLTLAWVESPAEPQFPKSDKLQLALRLILEELFEAAESAPQEELESFLNYTKSEVEEAFDKIRKNGGKKEGDLMELRDACADMRVVMGNLIHFAGIKDQFNEDLKEVMDSNFSKFCTTEEEADKSVKAYGKGNHPNKMGDVIECYHEKVGDYWIVKRKSDNKVLKSVDYVEPNFTKI